VKIRDEHMFRGAALIQIAEHPQFTAINSLKIKNLQYPNAYRVNEDIAVYLKYRSEPNESFGEYQFTFHKSHLAELAQITLASDEAFIVLVCVEGREVCCLSHAQLLSLIERRVNAAGRQEDQYVVLVTIPTGKSLRVYINAPGVKKTKLGKDIVVSRNSFPTTIFA
jgi:hypothetical protein